MLGEQWYALKKVLLRALGTLVCLPGTLSADEGGHPLLVLSFLTVVSVGAGLVIVIAYAILRKLERQDARIHLLRYPIGVLLVIVVAIVMLVIALLSLGAAGVLAV